MHRRQKQKRQVINWNDVYDPFHPTDLEQYNAYLKQVSAKHREREAYLERKRRADGSQGSSDSDPDAPSKPKFMFKLDEEPRTSAPIPLSTQYNQLMAESTAEEIYARRLAMQQQVVEMDKTKPKDDASSVDSEVERLVQELDEDKIPLHQLELHNLTATFAHFTNDILSEVQDECEQYGSIQSFELINRQDKPVVLVEYNNKEDLDDAYAIFNGRRFAGRTVVAKITHS